MWGKLYFPITFLFLPLCSHRKIKIGLHNCKRGLKFETWHKRTLSMVVPPAYKGPYENPRVQCMLW